MVSWALGSGLLVYVTLTGAGQQSPEWYAVIGGLLGGPFVTLWKEGRKKKAENGKATSDDATDSSADGQK